MAHPNNKGKGTYTQQRKEFALSSENRKYQREWKRKNRHKYIVTTNLWKEKNKNILMWSYYRSNAKKRGLEFLLTRQDFFSMIKEDCLYCGDKANPLNGIDRKDSNKGYNKTNCVPCCGQCNIIKMDYSFEDFIERCTKIVKRYAERITQIL